VAVVGGAKVTDKIGVLDAFLERARPSSSAGAMCFPFFAGDGHGRGPPRCARRRGIEPARRIVAEGRRQESSYRSTS
jgi:phosphoglycerate kinase